MSKAKIHVMVDIDCEINLEWVYQYLLNKGWKDSAPWGKYGRILKKGENAIGYVSNDKIADFNARISELVQDLATFENMKVMDLLKELLWPPIDFENRSNIDNPLNHDTLNEVNEEHEVKGDTHASIP